MTRATFPGGLYSIALPDGSRIVEYGDRIEINGVPIPSIGMRVLAMVARRIAGTVYLAGQGHDDGQCWLWNGVAWSPLGLTYGVRPCAFGDDSIFFAIGDAYRRVRLPSGETTDHPLVIGSQGLRYVAVDVPVAGDATLFDGTVHEFIDRGDLRVGQGHWGGCLINGRLLEPGDCQFINFERDGDSIAVAIVKFLEGQSVLHFLSRAEVDLLPLPTPHVEPPPIVVPPKPEPKPMPTPQMPAAAWSIVQRMFNEKRFAYDATEDGARAWTKAVAEQLKFSLPAEGWGAKARDANAPLSKDVVAHPRPDGSGLIEGWELLTSAGSKGPRELTNPPAYQSLEGQAVIPVEPVNHLGIVTVPGNGDPIVVPPPVPVQTPPPSGDYEARIHLLEQTVSRILSVMHSV